MEEQITIRMTKKFKKDLQERAKKDKRKLADWIRITLESIIYLKEGK